MKKKRRRLSVKGTRRRSKAVDRIIKLKVKYNLSEEHLSYFVELLNPSEAELILRLVRKVFQNDDYCAHRLHGCAGCDDFIWIHNEKMDCPNCNNMDGRYLYFFILSFLLF